MSAAEEALAAQLDDMGLVYEREYRFGAMASGGVGKGLRERLKASGLSDWRFDFAFTDCMLAVEVMGGVYSFGSHTRGAGYENDIVKASEAFRLGWAVLSFSTRHVQSGYALKIIAEALDGYSDGKILRVLRKDIYPKETGRQA